MASVATVGAQTWGACTVTNGSPPTPVPINSVEHNCTTFAACDGQADVMFVMDGSSSITFSDSNAYTDAVAFMKDLAMSFSMGDNLVRVGMVQYSAPTGSLGTCDSVNGVCDASVLEKFEVQELTGNPKQLCAVLDRPMIASGTPILEGLQVAHCAMKAAQSNAKFMVFITDGKPPDATKADIVALAQQIRNESVTIFAIGVGGTEANPTADVSLLRQIASLPVDDHLFHADKFSELLAGNFSKR